MSWSYRFVHWKSAIEGGDFEEGVELAEVYWHEGQDGIKARSYMSASFSASSPDELEKAVQFALQQAQSHLMINEWDIVDDHDDF